MTTSAKPRSTQAEAKLARAFAELRRRAEQRMREQAADPASTRSEADTLRLVHELQVHQVELEMQNEELQMVRDELRAGLEKYSDLFDFAPVGYLTLDREGVIEEVNLAAASLLGIERSRLVRQRLAAHFAAADLPGFNTLLSEVFGSEIRGSCELTLVHNHPAPVAARIEAALGSSGTECRLVLLDITGRKRAEEDRLTLNKLESTGILAGGIAHDFNNLLTVILLDIERTQATAPSGAEGALPLAEAKKADLSARRLTQQLITFSKGGVPVRKPTRLAGIIQESVRLPLSGSQVRCELSVAADLWTANVDEGQIGQVIRNLVLNAREAMPNGGAISVRAENVTLGASKDSHLPPGDYARLTVADRGCGMSKEVLAKVFDPYFSTKQRGPDKGTGLGLTICHAIIEKHGGAMAVTSEVGVGTTFVVHVPACPRGMTVTPAPVAVGRTIPGKSSRILVMDDEEPVRNVISRTLLAMGYVVELAGDGLQAIEIYRNAKNEGRPFDLVCLDLTVRGGIGGQATLRALREIEPKVKAIVMSGYAQDSAVRHPGLHGFAGVLAKPFDGARLRSVVAQILGSGQDSEATS